MYNEERKLQYIYKKQKEVILPQNYLESCFHKTEKFETKYGKDLSEWTVKEIVSYYKYYDSKSLNVLTVLTSTFFGYTNWCIAEGLVPDGQNHFAEITQEILGTCINYMDFDDCIINREDLVEMLPQLLNEVDKFFILALFEGIKGDYLTEITHFKISSISGLTAKLYTGRDVVISQQLKDYAYSAARETVYYVYSDDITRAEEMIGDEDSVFKVSARMRTVNDMNCDRSLTNRYQKIQNFLGLPSGLTMKKLYDSGEVDMVRQLMKESGLSSEAVLKAPGLKAKIEKQYSRIKSIPSFLIKYGRYLQL